MGFRKEYSKNNFFCKDNKHQFFVGDIVWSDKLQGYFWNLFKVTRFKIQYKTL